MRTCKEEEADEPDEGDRKRCGEAHHAALRAIVIDLMEELVNAGDRLGKGLLPAASLTRPLGRQEDRRNLLYHLQLAWGVGEG